jgi:hypothetical protein
MAGLGQNRFVNLGEYQMMLRPTFRLKALLTTMLLCALAWWLILWSVGLL